MTGPLYRTGGVCSRHHWIVIAVWVIAVAALAIGSRAVGEQNSDNLTLPGTGSTDAQDLLKAKLPKQAYGTNPVVLQATKGKLTDSANSKAVDATVKSLKKDGHWSDEISRVRTSHLSIPRGAGGHRRVPRGGENGIVGAPRPPRSRGRGDENL